MPSRAKRRFAQHFLQSVWVDRVVDIIQPQPTDTFIEIGAGRGALTLALARSRARIIAVEIDRDLVASLRPSVPSNVTIIERDVLALDLAHIPDLPDEPIRVVGNLPYSVGSPILLALLQWSGHGTRLKDAVVMLQREVADRVTASPNSRDWGPLAIATRLHAEPARALSLPPGAFRPIPRVRSAVVTLRFRPPPVSVRDSALLNRIVRGIFTQRRKTAVNALRPLVSQLSRLSAEEVFRQAGVDPRHRPAELELAELAELSDVLAANRD